MTENVPPPIPIIVEKQPIAVGITVTAGPRGTAAVRLRLSGSSSIFIATRKAIVAKMIASTLLCTCEAIHAPSNAPSSTKIAQRLTIAKSTAPRRWWARADEMDVGMMVASDVATAMCMRIAGSTPTNPSAVSSTGTITMPPPIPNNPASTPATAPVASIATPRMSHCSMISRSVAPRETPDALR